MTVMPEPAPHPITLTGELTLQESEAVNFFLTYTDDVQHILRNPREIHDREERGSFQSFLSHLDNALSKSTVLKKKLLYRGMSPVLAETLLFMLDVKTPPEEGIIFPGFIPHVIQDPGYTFFSGDPVPILGKFARKRRNRVIFTYSGGPGDSAMAIGNESGQVVYPRNVAWVTTGYTSLRWGSGYLIIISLDKDNGEAA